MQIDFVPELPSSDDCEIIELATDVISRYLLAYTKNSKDEEAVAKVTFNFMTNHAYLPTTNFSDKGSVFRSQEIKKIAEVLGITLQHAATKHAQRIGKLERTHVSLKKAIKIETGERRSMWHKYVIIAFLNYNTSYHTNMGCEPSRVFQGRIPNKVNVLNLKMDIRPQKNSTQKSEIAEDFLKQTEIIFQDVRKNTMQAYIQYKAYYHKKTERTTICVCLTV